MKKESGTLQSSQPMLHCPDQSWDLKNNVQPIGD